MLTTTAKMLLLKRWKKKIIKETRFLLQQINIPSLFVFRFYIPDRIMFNFLAISGETFGEVIFLREDVVFVTGNVIWTTSGDVELQNHVVSGLSLKLFTVISIFFEIKRSVNIGFFLWLFGSFEEKNNVMGIEQY